MFLLIQLEVSGYLSWEKATIDMIRTKKQVTCLS